MYSREGELLRRASLLVCLFLTKSVLRTGEENNVKETMCVTVLWRSYML